MALDLMTVNDTPLEIGTTPFFTGGEAVFFNSTAGELIVQGADEEDGDYTELVAVPAGGMAKAADLTPWIKVSTAATVYALAAL